MQNPYFLLELQQLRHIREVISLVLGRIHYFFSLNAHMLCQPASMNTYWYVHMCTYIHLTCTCFDQPANMNAYSYVHVCMCVRTYVHLTFTCFDQPANMNACSYVHVCRYKCTLDVHVL